jgi:hypothetical protein
MGAGRSREPLHCVVEWAQGVILSELWWTRERLQQCEADNAELRAGLGMGRSSIHQLQSTVNDLQTQLSDERAASAQLR